MEEEKTNNDSIETIENNTFEKLSGLIEDSLDRHIEQGITMENIDILFKLVDIHKDIANEKYWKIKESENMRYGNYGTYSGYGRGSGYGDYGRDQYGRDQYGRGRYRGQDHLDRMYEDYGRYAESRERYGASEETDKSQHYMVESLKDFIKYLFEEAETPQQKQMIREALQQSMM